MARSHHRKKHKAHLRQFKEKQDVSSTPASRRSSASVVFAIAGAITGLCISYFATSVVSYWLIVGSIIGGIIGLMIGRRLDKNP